MDSEVSHNYNNFWVQTLKIVRPHDAMQLNFSLFTFFRLVISKYKDIYQGKNIYFYLEIVIILSFIPVYYIEEKRQRSLFYSENNQANKLAAYKQAVDKLIPSSIFICTPTKQMQKFPYGLKVSFCNQTSQQIFGFAQPQDVIDQVRNIQVPIGRRQSQKNRQTLVQVIQSQFNQSKSKKKLKSIQTGEIRFFQPYKEDIYQNCVFIDPEMQVKQYYDIQLIHCQWDSWVSIMVILDDTSEKMFNQRLKEINDYQDELISTISHNLKTPLNGIIGTIRQVQNQSSRTKVAELNVEALNMCTLLECIVNDLLDYTRVLKGNFKIQKKDFNLINLFDEIFGLYQFQINNQKIQYLLEYSTEKERSFFNVKSDYKRLRQILVTLIGNSIKFTSKGKIQLQIEAAPDAEDTIFKISVIDTGIGIESDRKESIFTFCSPEMQKQFQQTYGAGISLAIAKSLLKYIGPYDYFQLQSVVGSGTQFAFYIYKEPQNLSLISPHSGDLSPAQRTPQKMLEKLEQLQIDIIQQAEEFKAIEELRSEDEDEFDNIEELKSQKELINKIIIDVERQYHTISSMKNDQIIEIEGNQQQFLEVEQSRPQIMDKEIFKQFIAGSQYQKSHDYQEEQYKQKLENLFTDNSTYNILIVDDNYMNIEVISMLLCKLENLNIEKASNGVEAIEYVKATNFDLIFMDVNMPVMDGLSAIQKIREIQENNPLLTTPSKIIVVSAFDSEDDIENCINIGANSFIPQPVTETTFFETLNNLLRKQNSKM